VVGLDEPVMVPEHLQLLFHVVLRKEQLWILFQNQLQPRTRLDNRELNNRSILNFIFLKFPLVLLWPYRPGSACE
jgi:hypothetical protein